jgi:uncharacterized membrane-anchored protein YhcB (DUF1043 family)
MNPLSIWLVVGASSVIGVVVGILFERTRGSAAKRAAQVEAELVETRSELMRYQEHTDRQRRL